MGELLGMNKVKNKDGVKVIGVGEIPLMNYILFLDSRKFSIDEVIEYTKDIYDIDISNIDWNSLPTLRGISLTDKFNNTEKKPKREDDGSRSWFNTYGSKRYLKYFTNEMYDGCDLTWDEVFGFNFFGENIKFGSIHHIYPLCYSKDNSNKNLILVSDIVHDLFCLNPFENNRKICFQGLDYMAYLLNHRNLNKIYEKYNINNKLNDKAKLELFITAIKIEIEEFFDKVKERIIV